MSVSWFELPQPAELGDGWSLRFLTAAQMLECRGEGEAKAAEERDKALWANAALLARVLLKEGEPAFANGEDVLEHLTVGQIEGLTRRWWAQDDLSGRTAQEGWPVQEERAFREKRAAQERGIAQREWTDREQGENEKFDMARFLELGGEVSQASQAPVDGGFSTAGTAKFPQVWPQAEAGVWPQSAPAQSVPERVQRMYRQPYVDGGTVMPYGGGAVPIEVPVSLPGQSVQGGDPFRAEYSVVQVLMPETVRAEGGVTIEELDRAVERDARRYDGGSTLY